ncbi:hypothetical protein R3P38DRAFT_2761878 [Favolaschia claudopus]|uniref:F-box domain-containing protein n=1 Tax=Favolaschia claudopus TaxID=2862362 RepID=A0AAW0DR62_9AGAR
MSDSDTDMDSFAILQDTPVSSDLSLEYGVTDEYLNRITSFQASNRVKLNTFPTELLTKICLLAPDRFNERPHEWAKSVFLLGCVCSRWLALVTSEPAFCASIAIHEDTSEDSLSALIEKSKSASLSLAFYFKPGMSRVKFFTETMHTAEYLLEPVMSRCTWIWVAAPDELTGYEILRRLVKMDGSRVACAAIQIPHKVRRVEEWIEDFHNPRMLFSAHTPLLRTLSLSSSILPWDKSQAFGHLTVLHLVAIDDPRPTVRQLYDVFAAASNLERLLISEVRCDEFIPLKPLPVTDSVLPRLTHLSLHVEQGEDTCVFNTLVLPSLQGVHVKAEYEEGAKGAFGHLGRAGRHVQSVALETFVNAPETVKSLLEAFPSVTRVDCRGSGTTLGLLLHAATVHWPGLWPHLLELRIDNIFPDIMILRLMTGLTGLSRPSTRILTPMFPDTSGDKTIFGMHYLDLSDENEKKIKMARSERAVSTDIPIFRLFST